jgi:selT/selW/selH-like putative selenoprotein
VAEFLQNNFPELRGKITGADYSRPIVEFLSNAISFCQVIIIAWMVVGGEKLLRMLPFYRTGPLPSFYWTVQHNPIPVAIFLFLLAPQVIKKMQSNGAFEVFLDNDILIFSKLKTGNLPAVDQLVQPLVEAGLKMSQSIGQ